MFYRVFFGYSVSVFACVRDRLYTLIACQITDQITDQILDCLSDQITDVISSTLHTPLDIQLYTTHPFDSMG